MRAMSVEIEWDEALEYVQQKVPKQVFDTWFLPVQFDRVENSIVYIIRLQRYRVYVDCEKYSDTLYLRFTLSCLARQVDCTVRWDPTCCTGQLEAGRGQLE